MKIKNCELKDETVLEIGKFTILWAEFEKNAIIIVILKV